MKLKILALALMVMFVVPMALAQTDLNAQTNAQAEVVTMNEVRMMKVGESVNDFFFNVRSSLTFNQESKVDLLEQRNEALKQRQQAWIELNQRIDADSSAQARADVVAEIRQRNNAIVKEHIEITSKIRSIAVEANSSNNAELSSRAYIVLDRVESSNINAGLETVANLGINLPSQAGSGLNTSAEARAIVQSRLGLDSVDVQTRSRNGVEYFVVIGVEEDLEEGSEGSYEVWVRKNDGAIVTVDMKASINVGVNVDTRTRSDSGSSATVTTETSAGDNNSGAEVRSDTRIGIGTN